MKKLLLILTLFTTLFGAGAPMVFEINTNLSTGTIIEVAVRRMNSPTLTIDYRIIAQITNSDGSKEMKKSMLGIQR